LPISLLASSPAAAAPEDVTFVFEPIGAQTRYIKLFRFNRCRGQRRDPWSEIDCGPWIYVQHNQVRSNVRGRWCVFAQWDDERHHRGAFTMDPGGVATAYPVTPKPKGTCA